MLQVMLVNMLARVVDNYIHTVTLTSSADILCPGDTVVFTCVTTDTGRLVWEINDINNRHSFHSPAQINISIPLGIFTLTLLSVTNNSIYQSTAVAHNISVDYNGTKVSCRDGQVYKPEQMSITLSKISVLNFKLLLCIIMQISHLHHLHLST